MDGYFLSGVNDEHILVFRTEDSEDILRVIRKLSSSRDKEIKNLAERLELEWYERYQRYSGETKSKGR